MNPHHRILKSGLLAGPTDTASRHAWPAWAREHVVDCWECNVYLFTLPMLRDADEDRRPIPPAPTVAELLARPRLPAVAPEDFADDMKAFPPKTYRPGRSGGLEIVRTAGGARAWDPDAVHILVFNVAKDRTEFLAEQYQDAPGVCVDLVLPRGDSAHLVAFGFAEEAETEMWRFWLSDWRSRSDRPALEGGLRVHLAELTIRADDPRIPLRLVPDPFPEPPAHIRLALEEAAAAAREPDLPKAIRGFTRARDLGRAEGDGMALARGGIGLGQALFSLGFLHDSAEVLRDTVATCTLDPQRAGQACLAFAWRALLADEVEEAEGWVALALEVRPGSAWLPPVRRRIAFMRQAWRDFLRFDEEDGVDPEPGAARIRTCCAVIALSNLGAPDTARRRMGDAPGGGTLEVRLWQFAATACIEHAETGVWRTGLGAEVEAVIGAGQLDLWQVIPLAYLTSACAIDAPAEAGVLLKTRFLHPSADRRPVFALAGADGHVDASGPGGQCRPIAETRASLIGRIASLRDAIIMDREFEPEAQALTQILLPQHRLTETLLVASDGVLAGVPWPVLLAVGDHIPCVVEVLGRGASTTILPTGTRAVSLADPLDDLPLARAECAGMHWTLRGRDVTSAALAALGEVGLLHLGVHVQRQGGMPELVLGDGPMSAAAITELRLEGRPVVLLAGCASGDQVSPTGVERSLSDAFLRAGASAVVATRWPLTDDEAHAVFQPLLNRWPFHDLGFTVASLAGKMKRAGYAARVWASLAIYRA